MTEYVNLMKDGQFVAGPFTENLGFEYLLKVQGQSAEYALTYGGYSWQETENSPAMAVSDVLVGRKADGTRVYVDVALALQDGTGHKTVTHEVAPAKYLRFSAGGMTVAKHRRNPDCCGQMLDELLEIVEPAALALSTIQRLHGLWKAWHLNDMQAACRHMPTDARQKWDARESVICPDPTGNGYSYGAAWLVQPLPATVVHELQTIIRALQRASK